MEPYFSPAGRERFTLHIRREISLKGWRRISLLMGETGISLWQISLSRKGGISISELR
jgi:hypothetical protein